jgi:hypothetical protein
MSRDQREWALRLTHGASGPEQWRVVRGLSAARLMAGALREKGYRVDILPCETYTEETITPVRRPGEIRPGRLLARFEVEEESGSPVWFLFAFLFVSILAVRGLVALIADMRG